MICILEFMFNDKTSELVSYDKSNYNLNCDFINNILECEPQKISIGNKYINYYPNINIPFSSKEFKEYIENKSETSLLLINSFFNNNIGLKKITDKLLGKHSNTTEIINILKRCGYLYDILKQVNDEKLLNIIKVNDCFYDFNKYFDKNHKELKKINVIISNEIFRLQKNNNNEVFVVEFAEISRLIEQNITSCLNGLNTKCSPIPAIKYCNNKFTKINLIGEITSREKDSDGFTHVTIKYTYELDKNIFFTVSTLSIDHDICSLSVHKNKSMCERTITYIKTNKNTNIFDIDIGQFKDLIKNMDINKTSGVLRDDLFDSPEWEETHMTGVLLLRKN